MSYKGGNKGETKIKVEGKGERRGQSVRKSRLKGKGERQAYQLQLLQPCDPRIPCTVFLMREAGVMVTLIAKHPQQKAGEADQNQHRDTFVCSREKEKKKLSYL